MANNEYHHGKVIVIEGVKPQGEEHILKRVRRGVLSRVPGTEEYEDRMIGKFEFAPLDQTAVERPAGVVTTQQELNAARDRRFAQDPPSPAQER